MRKLHLELLGFLLNLRWLEPIRKCFYPLIPRFVLLIIAVVDGLFLLFIFGYCCQEYFINFFNIDRSSNFIGSFQLLLLGLPVFVLLWFFRTHDTKMQIAKSEEQIEQSEKQIAKSEEQINQADYFKRFDNFASNDLLKTAIGVRQLIALREITEEYDEGISIAFGALITLNKLGNKSIYSSPIDFSDIYLSRALLIKANLSKAFMSRAYLSFADLSGAFLIGADLSYADLKEVKLMDADLSDTDLSKAENLESAHFNGAFYEINQEPKGIDFEQLGYSLEAEELNGRKILRINKKN